MNHVHWMVSRSFICALASCAEREGVTGIESEAHVRELVHLCTAMSISDQAKESYVATH